MFPTATLVLTVSLAAPLSHDRRAPSFTLEQKLVGEWTNGGACIGDINFRADGTYERNHYGPGNATLSGKWKVRWDALVPTLVLTCEQSNREVLVGRTWEVQITRLDDDGLSLDAEQRTAGRFKRAKK